MISFIKKLFGIGSTESAPAAAPYKIEPSPAATYIEPAKPVIKTQVAATPSTAPAKKNRRPRNRNKARAGGGTVANINQAKPAVTEGKTKGGNGAVKQQLSNTAKPDAPAKVAKVKSTKPKQTAK
jgi:hypothetical protein